MRRLGLIADGLLGLAAAQTTSFMDENGTNYACTSHPFSSVGLSGWSAFPPYLGYSAASQRGIRFVNTTILPPGSSGSGSYMGVLCSGFGAGIYSTLRFATGYNLSQPGGLLQLQLLFDSAESASGSDDAYLADVYWDASSGGGGAVSNVIWTIDSARYAAASAAFEAAATVNASSFMYTWTRISYPLGHGGAGNIEIGVRNGADNLNPSCVFVYGVNVCERVPSGTPTPTATPTGTMTPSPSATASVTSSLTPSASVSPSWTHSPRASFTATATRSSSGSGSNTGSSTGSLSLSATASGTAASTSSRTGTPTPTPSVSPTATSNRALVIDFDTGSLPSLLPAGSVLDPAALASVVTSVNQRGGDASQVLFPPSGGGRMLYVTSGDDLNDNWPGTWVNVSLWELDVRPGWTLSLDVRWDSPEFSPYNDYVNVTLVSATPGRPPVQLWYMDVATAGDSTTLPWRSLSYTFPQGTSGAYALSIHVQDVTTPDFFALTVPSSVMVDNIRLQITSPSPSVTASRTRSPSGTPSRTGSNTGSLTSSPSATRSISASASPSATPFRGQTVTFDGYNGTNTLPPGWVAVPTSLTSVVASALQRAGDGTGILYPPSGSGAMLYLISGDDVNLGYPGGATATYTFPEPMQPGWNLSFDVRVDAADYLPYDDVVTAEVNYYGASRDVNVTRVIWTASVTTLGDSSTSGWMTVTYQFEGGVPTGGPVTLTLRAKDVTIPAYPALTIPIVLMVDNVRFTIRPPSATPTGTPTGTGTPAGTGTPSQTASGTGSGTGTPLGTPSGSGTPGPASCTSLSLSTRVAWSMQPPELVLTGYPSFPSLSNGSLTISSPVVGTTFSLVLGGYGVDVYTQVRLLSSLPVHPGSRITFKALYDSRDTGLDPAFNDDVYVRLSVVTPPGNGSSSSNVTLFAASAVATQWDRAIGPAWADVAYYFSVTGTATLEMGARNRGDNLNPPALAIHGLTYCDVSPTASPSASGSVSATSSPSGSRSTSVSGSPTSTLLPSPSVTPSATPNRCMVTTFEGSTLASLASGGWSLGPDTFASAAVVTSSPSLNADVSPPLTLLPPSGSGAMLQLLSGGQNNWLGTYANWTFFSPAGIQLSFRIRFVGGESDGDYYNDWARVSLYSPGADVSIGQPRLTSVWYTDIAALVGSGGAAAGYVTPWQSANVTVMSTGTHTLSFHVQDATNPDYPTLSLPSGLLVDDVTFCYRPPPTGTASASITPSGTSSPSNTMTSSRTGTGTPSNTGTSSSSGTGSKTGTASVSFGWTATPSGSGTPSLTGSITGTPSDTPSNSPTASLTHTGSGSRTGTASSSATGSRTSSGTSSDTPASTGSSTSSQTASLTGTGTPASTGTATSSQTGTGSSSGTATGTRSRTPSLTPTSSPSQTSSASNTGSASRTMTSSVSVSATPTRTAPSTRSPALSPARTASTTPKPVAVFTYTGGYQYWTVPTGVNSVTVHAWGGGGGGATVVTRGGGGAYVTGTLPVTPGETLQIVVGRGGTYPGTPGTPGQGSGGGSANVDRVTQNQYGGGGGGYSAIFQRSSLTAPYQPSVVAAGGGGGGGWWSSGGAGGMVWGRRGGDQAADVMPVDVSANSDLTSLGGGAANQAQGGVANFTGGSGGYLYGGSGALCRRNQCGGGGGGYYGGAAGDDAAGGGGSSYIGGLTSFGGEGGTLADPGGNDSDYYVAPVGLGGYAGGAGVNGRVILVMPIYNVPSASRSRSPSQSKTRVSRSHTPTKTPPPSKTRTGSRTSTGTKKITPSRTKKAKR